MIEKTKKRRKLSHEILGIFAVCFLISLLLCLFLTNFGTGIIEEYCFYHDIALDEDAFYRIDNSVFTVSIIVSVAVFIILFLALFGERIAYIRAVTDAVDAMQRGDFGKRAPLKGNNELTRLAETVNYLSVTEQTIKARERQLNDEKEALIRTLSHDIRTPLTAILSYTELLSDKDTLTPEEQREYLALVKKKSLQIKALTEILLDGGQRHPEDFEDARLLMEQLADEFTETLEEQFPLTVDLSHLSAFSGCFDVGELRRIFDNLISNVQKYADPAKEVFLSIEKKENGIEIKQKNTTKAAVHNEESHRMGIQSIRRIAQHYDGSVGILQNGDLFEITVTLSKY
ncbi:MAG: sensor histidine kinase [Clostridia bacterium]|nr:sensor histidine kinase [Clostridia bacterium]